jgi:hypothetical protein
MSAGGSPFDHPDAPRFALAIADLVLDQGVLPWQALPLAIRPSAVVVPAEGVAQQPTLSLVER